MNADITVLDALTKKYPLAEIFAEGKTKIGHRVRENPRLAHFSAKKDITAFNGLKHDIMEGKDILATETTCNIFRSLQQTSIPLAFVEQDSPTSFVALMCRMIPLEVVMRRHAYGSYLKRNPEAAQWERLDPIVVELYLKTTGKIFKGHQLPVDDPYLDWKEGDEQVRLYHPDHPLERPFLTLKASDVFDNDDEQFVGDCRWIGATTFFALEDRWRKVDCDLIDLKIECGIGPDGKPLLADVIDADSGRYRDRKTAKLLDKQIYREGGTVEETASGYRRIMELTSQFQRS